MWDGFELDSSYELWSDELLSSLLLEFELLLSESSLEVIETVTEFFEEFIFDFLLETF